MTQVVKLHLYFCPCKTNYKGFIHLTLRDMFLIKVIVLVGLILNIIPAFWGGNDSFFK